MSIVREFLNVGAPAFFLAGAVLVVLVGNALLVSVKNESERDEWNREQDRAAKERLASRGVDREDVS